MTMKDIVDLIERHIEAILNVADKSSLVIDINLKLTTQANDLVVRMDCHGEHEIKQPPGDAA